MTTVRNGAVRVQAGAKASKPNRRVPQRRQAKATTKRSAFTIVDGEKHRPLPALPAPRAIPALPAAAIDTRVATAPPPPSHDAPPAAVEPPTELGGPATNTRSAPPTTTPDNHPSPEDDPSQDDPEAALVEECQVVRRQMVAHEVACMLGWYAVADAVADLHRRYAPAVKNISRVIGDALNRTARWVYLLLEVAKHPPALRARVAEVGLADDQGRLRQLAGLDVEQQEAALTAFASGGPKAFDHVVKRQEGLDDLEDDPKLQALLSSLLDPRHPLGVVAVQSPDAPVPLDLARQAPCLTGMTYAEACAHARRSISESTAVKGAAASGKTKGAKPRRFADGFELPVNEERDVNLRKARLTLLIANVVGSDGKPVPGAVATVMVCDRTL